MAVSCPPGKPGAFLLCKVNDLDQQQLSVTWLEQQQGGMAANPHLGTAGMPVYRLTDTVWIHPRTIICTVRSPGAWLSAALAGTFQLRVDEVDGILAAVQVQQPPTAADGSHPEGPTRAGAFCGPFSMFVGSFYHTFSRVSSSSSAKCGTQMLLEIPMLLERGREAASRLEQPAAATAAATTAVDRI